MKRGLLVVLTCLGILGVWLVSKRLRTPPHPVTSFPAVPTQDHEFYKSIRPGCPSEVREMLMEDPYLRGIIEPGANFQAALNYYQCNPPVRGDLVLYRFSWKFMPVARQIVAVPGDKILLKKRATGWELWINGKVHLGGNQKFIFGDPAVNPPLQNYIEAHKGLVQEKHVLVLSSFPPGEKDSSVFGAVDLSDIVGKITL